jgi:alpha-beta hydrolase superfamily lysophospholipase
MPKFKEWTRPASSGREPIYSCSYTPGDGKEVKALIQISHGMSETAVRYAPFMQYLAGEGYAVFMNEHAGHGTHAETLGYFSDQPHGLDYVVADMKALEDEMREQHPGKKVFLFGHSMGSFLSRKYITLYGAGLAGCILSGTAGKNPALPAGKILSSIQMKLKGPKSQGKLLSVIAFGTYTKKIQDPVNHSAWLSRDEELCKAYAKDPLCGFHFTAKGFRDMFELLGEVNEQDWYKKVPQTLPILLLSGEEDPVGNYGKGVIEVHDSLKSQGTKDLTITLYKEGRHEMLNELNKEEVYSDILTWLTHRLRD